ncbi:MAG: sulfite exporter TauE/SafE family protein [Aquificaceae bacterium]
MEAHILAFFASLLAGAINAVAGGGTLITFPSLVWLGLDPVVANISNTVALWVGSLTGAFGFKDRLKESKDMLLYLFLSSVIGALAGALLLIKTPSKTFRDIVPFLIFFAVLMLTLSEFIKGLLARFVIEDGRLHPLIPASLQFLTGVYGSYFGAGIGIMMLASLTLSGIHNIHTANGIKNLLGFTINLVGALIFVLGGKVSWTFALAMMPGFALGGYVGARISQRFKPKAVKTFVIGWGILIGLYMLLIK